MTRFDEPGADIRPFRHRDDLWWRPRTCLDDPEEIPCSVEILGRGPIVQHDPGGWRAGLPLTTALRPLMDLHIPLHVAYGHDLPRIDRSGFASRLDAWLHGPALLTRSLEANGDPAAALADLSDLARLAGARHGGRLALRLHLEPHGGYRDVHAVFADGRVLALPNDAPLRRAAHCVALHHQLRGHDTQVVGGWLKRAPLVLDVAPSRAGLRAAAARLRAALPNEETGGWLRTGALALLRGPVGTDGWRPPWCDTPPQVTPIPGTPASLVRHAGRHTGTLLIDGVTLAPDPAGGPLVWAQRPWAAATVDLTEIGIRAAEAVLAAARRRERRPRRTISAWGSRERPAWIDPEPERIAALVLDRIYGRPGPDGAPPPDAFLRAVLEQLRARHGGSWGLRIHCSPNPLFRDSVIVEAPSVDVWTRMRLEELAQALVAARPPGCAFSWFSDGTGHPTSASITVRGGESSAHERLAGAGVIRRALAAYGRPVRLAHAALSEASREAERDRTAA